MMDKTLIVRLQSGRGTWLICLRRYSIKGLTCILPNVQAVGNYTSQRADDGTTFKRPQCSDACTGFSGLTPRCRPDPSAVTLALASAGSLHGVGQTLSAVTACTSFSGLTPRCPADPSAVTLALTSSGLTPRCRPDPSAVAAADFSGLTPRCRPDPSAVTLALASAGSLHGVGQTRVQ
ncbi:hypothetical protein CYMTET_26153 [Cymbomonas tetramitiformis]|uniref:Uncharacterized protein n=1 Tax=Cymbomonas tetramitiformis TaxID=36881 RepID=A0AAE0FTX1_9CHLO|nr:hypothetical protein CYMTET_26153 [Cymbomonas tetramitiformis]